MENCVSNGCFSRLCVIIVINNKCFNKNARGERQNENNKHID